MQIISCVVNELVAFPCKPAQKQLHLVDMHSKTPLRCLTTQHMR